MTKKLRWGILGVANINNRLLPGFAKDIKYDEVIQMISEAKKLGIDRVGLATR